MKHLLLCCDHVFANKQNFSAAMSWILAEQETNINHMLGHVPGDYI